VTLPENTRVFVVVSSGDDTSVARVLSPHLVRQADARDFVKQVIKDPAT
jgi:hypothetical protein